MKAKASPIVIFFILLSGLGNVFAVPNLSDIAVIGDHFRIEFYSDIMPEIIDNYSIELFHGATIQAWIEKTPWADYPDHFNEVVYWVNASHVYGIPITAAYSYGPSEWQGDISEPYGFLYIYRALPDELKWYYPNGTLAEDPYFVGASRSYTGRITWRQGIGPIMQPQNPYWIEFLKYWGHQLIDRCVDGIWLDSQDLSFPIFWTGGFDCSNSWEKVSLEQYLKSKKIIPENESFCIKDYIQNHFSPTVHGVYGTERNYYPVAYSEYLDTNKASALFDDPVIREYLMFQHLSFLRLVKNLTQDLRHYSKGRVLLTSNLYEMWPESPWDIHGQLGVLSAPYFDAVYVERNTNLLPPFHRDMAVYKIAEAAGGFNKPVWVGEWTLFFSNPYPAPIPKNISTLLAILTAEGFAAGGVRTIPFGTGTSWPPNRLIYGPEKDMMERYARFIYNHKYLLLHTNSTSSIAIVFSVPTLLWEYFPAFERYGWKYKQAVAGWAHALETLNIQYDILIFGHPLLFNDSESLKRLSRYKLLILPRTCCISDYQVESLEDYIRNGGMVLFVGDTGTRDENYNPRNTPVYDILKNVSPDNVFYSNSTSAEEHYKSVFSHKYSLSSMKDVSDLLGRILQTNITAEPSPVGVSIRKKNYMTIIHLINYDYHYNSTRDWVVPKDNLTVTIPYNSSVFRVVLISPDQPSIELNYTLTTGRLLIDVPYLDVWDVIVIYERMPGDINGDGRITATDALLYLSFLVGRDVAPYLPDPAMDDLTGDGRITIADALKALRIAAGLENTEAFSVLNP